MNQKKKILFLSILLMTIGFASVSTVLYLNGQTFVASNTGDFDVYFIKAVENGVENASIIQDKTHIEFTTELTGVDDTYILNYDVTNASKQYDANIVMNCTGGNEYLRVENKFDTTKILPARTTRSGVLTLTVIKAVMEETSVSISCEISGNAVERKTAGGDTITEEPTDFLKNGDRFFDFQSRFKTETYGSESEYTTQYNEACSDKTSETCKAFIDDYETKLIAWWQPQEGMYWIPLDWREAESLTIKATKEVPENAIRSWDASEGNKRTIMGYTLDENNNGLYEVYIGGNGGVLAPSNSEELFYGWFKATSINGLENLDTSKVTNMASMFGNCNNLTELDVSHFDTSNVINMSGMLSGLENVVTLDISHFDTSKVTDMSSMFDSCYKLEKLNLGEIDTSNVTDMQEIFDGCESLANLDVSYFDTSNVTNMSYMFNDCSSLVTIDLSNFNTSNVTDMHGMFMYETNMKTLDLSNFDTSNVTDMGSMFSECPKLSALSTSSFNTSNVTDMSFMLCKCSSLANLDLSHFDTSNVTNMRNMFEQCNTLTSLVLSNFDTSKATNMRDMFKDCSNLITLDIINFDTTNVIDMTGMFANCSKITTTITIRGTKCTSYAKMYSSDLGMFEGATTEEGAQITVNYTSDASTLVDKMIATKSSNSNVVKGTQVV